MRNYIPCWEKIGISKERYLELLYFCRQYDRWKHEAASMLGIRGHAPDGQPHGGGVGDPVYAAAEKRMAITRRIDIVERCAMSVGGGRWFVALIDNVCRGKPHAALDQSKLPTANRAEFFKARREFFLTLNEVRGQYDMTFTIQAGGTVTGRIG